MQVKKINVQELLSRLRIYLLENDLTRKYANEEPPLRAELFNTYQLEQHGKYLANIHRITTGQGKERLLRRLAKNEKILIEVRNLLTDAIKEKGLITPAGEWLLDNFYLIEDNIRTGKKHLPKGYSESLPRLINTISAGLPRVYDIALELISHSDGRIDTESLSSFIKAYQTVTNLQLGELWAIPIMLRLALIENLRRVSARVAIDRVNQNLADYWASLMTETAEKDPKSLILVIADMARSGPPMESSFVAELIRKLIWKGSSLVLPLTWMEQRLSEVGLTSSELVNLENQKQAADQVSISNSIGSLRFLSSIEWREFVEAMSAVEGTLRKDPFGIYPSMDFSTRDRYRHSVEKIAKNSNLPETDVASIALQLADEEAGKDQPDLRMAHVGYYLIGEGVVTMQRLTRQKLPWRERFQKKIKKFPLTFYSGPIILISFIVAGDLLFESYKEGAPAWVLIFTGIVSLLGASHLATTLVNWLATLLIKPDLLPRLDFSKGIPPECTTMAIVPTMLMNTGQVESLIENLEVRFLANRDRNLHFGILTDFPDANAQTLPEDEPVLELAKNKIEELNEKYSKSDDKFFMFHRPRKWNPYDKIWMGYERKRGKLTQLNALLRGNSKEDFSLIVGDTSTLPDVKYIITLDTDTQMPRDAAWKLIATMAHPLNRPLYDEKKQRITKGYGILQPRLSVSLSKTGSIYASKHANEAGIDPYTRLTSDVYQDLFEEGSFIGKGIYDIDAFEHAIKGRFPENRILSHDLLEGCYTRSGLLSDVQFYEEYPIDYSSDVNRRHRWIRGDWQIGYWSLPVAPDMNRRLHKNPLSALSRWKIFDNLRRSLVPAALTSMLLLGWIAFHACWLWTLSVILIVMLPSLIASGWNVVRKPKDVTLWQHIHSSFSLMADNLFQDAFMFICLPYEAFYCLDAILRTGWRMIISHKKLLEWNPSHNHEQTRDNTINTAYRSMWFSPVIAVLTLLYVSMYSPIRLVFAAPVLLLWILSPFIAWWVSKPFPKYTSKLSGLQIAFLRTIARKTWAFFENFAAAEDNWLPPDNYQLRPNNVVAHRTSPTNIGLSFLANLTAYDFGYITARQLIERTKNTMDTLDKMERYKGHLYNWYDTITLKPLMPKYISTVDSGNLAGHLLTLRQGLITIPNERIISPKLFEGLKDTFSIIENGYKGDAAMTGIHKIIQSVIGVKNVTTAYAVTSLKQLTEYSKGWPENNNVQADSDVYWWIKVLEKQCADIYEELYTLFPWLSLPEPPQKFRKLHDSINVSTINEIAGLGTTLLPEIQHFLSGGVTPVEQEWLDAFSAQTQKAVDHANEIITAIDQLALKCEEYANVDYEFLYDKSKHLLSIGYNAEDHIKDPGFYDLLASEASLCSFIAIAQGKLPQESWFALGRLLANVKGAPILLSWSGSMFEYLMPLLVMPVYENTLLYQSYKGAVERQIEYGSERNVPWGISESGYNAVDANLNYQYRAFGVPGLGLKRGLAEDLVIAPYASMLALMVAPEEACRNIERMASEGFSGRYGFFEAIDYTASRIPRGHTNVVIQSYMTHHQGMSLGAIAYALLDQPMQKRFEAELQFQATLLLLQERIPKATTYYSHSTDIETVSAVSGNTEMRVIKTPHTQIPEIQLLSNGKYNVMVTNAGGGYSRWRDMAVTRWREDSTCDNWGTFCYIRDLEDGAYWSNTYQPTLVLPKNYEATFTQGRAEFRRQDNNIETYTEIVVSPEDDIEMRRIHITNRSKRRRAIDITSYAEVTLNAQAADIIHPAFSNLFIQTEIIKQRHAIICTRRPRSVDEHPPWMFHLVTMHGASVGNISYETDRMKFIGRGNTIVNPIAMTDTKYLSDSQGAVLDPMVAIRYNLTLQPEETVIIDMITGISEAREHCIGLIEKYQDKHHKDRVFELAWTHSQVVLRQINATETDAQLYGQLASSIIFTNPSLRADPSVILKNNRGQSGLWGYSVSGDLPIVLLQIEKGANIELVKQLVQAHAYWRLKGLTTDLMIWNEDHGGYRQELQNQIQSLIAAGLGAESADRPGGIFVRSADQISNEDRILFQSVARINISDKKGSLQDHVNRRNTPKNTIPFITPMQAAAVSDTTVSLPEELQFFNEYGGFSPNGKEYVIITGKDQRTPAPWINILANNSFGSVISESGQSYTWVDNAHELRLTPWENDPVTDRSGEAFYIRDEENGNYWSPALLPASGRSPYITRHGFGYSGFEHSEDGIDSEMMVYTDIDAPVKFYVIKLKNNSGRNRHISVTGYIEWVLGDLKHKNAMHVITEVDPDSGALFAKNNYNKEFSGLICFFDTDDAARTVTGDRAEFIGRNGTLRSPDAMSRIRLSGKVGAALDPCGVIQTVFLLAEGQEKEIVFRLGAGRNAEDASMTVLKFRGVTSAHNALERVKNYWQYTLGSLQVNTPDSALNILTNGWLQYQTIACRLWARSGYYQSGGAYGFRDQLQDVLAVIHSNHDIARKQILLCASRQFVEGDVQHWWHPPTGNGVRTRCSDDLLWLPFVTSIYVSKTDDKEILNENVYFLEDRLLNAGEESNYSVPIQSSQSGSLFEHCKRAINYGMKYGSHGLVLMGSGDWNDGMDRVGRDGKGESIWLSFFLYDTLIRFSDIAKIYSDTQFAEKCITEANQLKQNIENNGWDGKWYRRAYFDNGTPLGSSENAECKIDSISQSWAILSGAGDPQHAQTALAIADQRLVQNDYKLIQLLDPPFDKSGLNPGYIKGYLPGIRENGGQYTHAAIWMIMAYAKSGNAKRAWELLNMINPVNHGSTKEGIATYKVEPYVVAADVYSVLPNKGRGGWTWYTGSAGWMYQLIIEWLLGIKQQGNKLQFLPCIPAEWESYKIDYRYLETTYNITITKKQQDTGGLRIMADGIEQADNVLALVNDKAEHTIEVMTIPSLVSQEV